MAQQTCDVTGAGDPATAAGTDALACGPRANAGIAGAMAVASIPQPMSVGKTMIGMGTATWRDEVAFSFGASHAFDGAVVEFGATVDGRGNGGANAGVGFEF